MSENCNNDCSNCSVSDCQERTDFSLQLNPQSSIKKVIGVVSGKGGVGKSTITSMLAVTMNRLGYKTAILDADLTGPSIPKAFGITSRAMGTELGLLPAVSKTGIEIMSANLLLEDTASPLVWRGPMIAGAVEQFWTDVIWDDIDFMFIDMPPGTGDVPLTIFQSIPVDGIVVVASPQELVSMIVEKAVKMAEIMDVPILGLVENMSYFICPTCDEKHAIFGESNLEKIAEQYGLKVLARLPMDQRLSAACDKGVIELFDGDWLEEFSESLNHML